MKKKWIATIAQNGDEYTGWITFYAEKVVQKDERLLDVDGFELEADESILSIDVVEEN